MRIVRAGLALLAIGLSLFALLGAQEPPAPVEEPPRFRWIHQGSYLSLLHDADSNQCALVAGQARESQITVWPCGREGVQP